MTKSLKKFIEIEEIISGRTKGEPVNFNLLWKIISIIDNKPKVGSFQTWSNFINSKVALNSAEIARAESYLNRSLGNPEGLERVIYFSLMALLSQQNRFESLSHLLDQIFKKTDSWSANRTMEYLASDMRVAEVLVYNKAFKHTIFSNAIDTIESGADNPSSNSLYYPASVIRFWPGPLNYILRGLSNEPTPEGLKKRMGRALVQSVIDDVNLNSSFNEPEIIKRLIIDKNFSALKKILPLVSKANKITITKFFVSSTFNLSFVRSKKESTHRIWTSNKYQNNCF